MKRQRKAFTLIELMIVVSIIIILASLAVPSFVKYREASYAAKCVANLRGIQDARESYFLDHVGVTEIQGSETDFLRYFGEMTSSGDSSMVLADSDLILCPYNDAAYVLGVNYSSITVMPTCPNRGGAADGSCAGHIYSAR